MNNQVVVTLCIGREETDYALPCNTKLSELYKRLLDVLQTTHSDTFRKANGICLRREDGYLLDPNATLLDYGVKDGERLAVIMEG